MTSKQLQRQPKPPWLKVRLPMSENHGHIKEVLRQRKLVTVCEEAHCPNIGECWATGTATFMLMGDTCTRGCRFCAVKTGNPRQFLDKDEPLKIAEAVAEMNLDYVVLTSVDRDDLPDGGAEHFAQTIRAIKQAQPKVIVEVLIPDFQNNIDSINQIIDAKPEVIAHNIETVSRLTRRVRDVRSTYPQSLSVLQKIKEIDPSRFTKSSIMLGLGESTQEIIETMKDLRQVGVDVLTLGQYLQPSRKHIAVEEFVTPDQFDSLGKEAENLGFLYVASGPLVRSSYKAGEFFIRNIIEQSRHKR